MRSISIAEVQQLVSQLFAEKQSQALLLLRELAREPCHSSLQEQFLCLPISERRRLLAQQADELAGYYEKTASERQDWQMEWFNACMNPAAATCCYAIVPPLDPFRIYACDLDTGMPSFQVSGFLPRLPDNPNLPEGQVADRAELHVAFMDLADLKLSGAPERRGGAAA